MLVAIAIGRNRRNDPAVLAVTLSESEAGPNDDLLFQSVLVIFARFLGAGPSSPSVPSSYPEVFPPTAAVLGWRGFLGLLMDALDDGRDVFFAFPPFNVLPRVSFPEFSAFAWLKGSI